MCSLTSAYPINPWKEGHEPAENCSTDTGNVNKRALSGWEEHDRKIEERDKTPQQINKDITGSLIWHPPPCPQASRCPGLESDRLLWQWRPSELNIPSAPRLSGWSSAPGFLNLTHRVEPRFGTEETQRFQCETLHTDSDCGFQSGHKTPSHLQLARSTTGYTQSRVKCPLQQSGVFTGIQGSSSNPQP